MPTKLGFPFRPPKVKLLAGEQKAAEFKLLRGQQPSVSPKKKPKVSLPLLNPPAAWSRISVGPRAARGRVGISLFRRDPVNYKTSSQLFSATLRIPAVLGLSRRTPPKKNEFNLHSQRKGEKGWENPAVGQPKMCPKVRDPSKWGSCPFRLIFRSHPRISLVHFAWLLGL